MAPSKEFICPVKEQLILDNPPANIPASLIL